MLQVQLPDGSIVEHPATVTALEVAEKIGSRLAKAVVDGWPKGQRYSLV